MEVVLRFRHPRAAAIKGITVNGKAWTEFNPEKETITLKGLTGTVAVTAKGGRNMQTGLGVLDTSRSPTARAFWRRCGRELRFENSEQESKRGVRLNRANRERRFGRRAAPRGFDGTAGEKWGFIGLEHEQGAERIGGRSLSTKFETNSVTEKIQ
jgi:hypothetical protein